MHWLCVGYRRCVALAGGSRACKNVAVTTCLVKLRYAEVAVPHTLDVMGCPVLAPDPSLLAAMLEKPAAPSPVEL